MNHNMMIQYYVKEAHCGWISWHRNGRELWSFIRRSYISQTQRTVAEKADCDLQCRFQKTNDQGKRRRFIIYWLSEPVLVFWDQQSFYLLCPTTACFPLVNNSIHAVHGHGQTRISRGSLTVSDPNYRQQQHSDHCHQRYAYVDFG